MRVLQAFAGLALSGSVAASALRKPESHCVKRDDAPPGCHCLPGDACWPSEQDWQQFNKTVDGRLVATKPLAAVCHDPDYDEEACRAIQDRWLTPDLHYQTSSSIMQPYFANNTCDPFTDRALPCEVGNYVSYSVNVAKADHVAASLKFTREHNIRVLVRNTGHDFLGRSTGAGALAIWTHNLKTAEATSWKSKVYNGPAMRFGAGIFGAEGLEAAHAADLVVISGECPTVGLAGGFTQGGGHSALSTNFGLGADQVLEYTVVTADGKVVKASDTENTDLFWAMRGGGGGTYGVATELVVRAYPEAQVGGAGIQIGASYTTPEIFKEVVARFHKLLPDMLDQGASVVYYTNTQMLTLNPVTVYNATGDYVRDTIIKPFKDFLDEKGVPASIAYTTLSYRDHYEKFMGPLPNGHLDVSAYQFGSRLIPRSLLEDPEEPIVPALEELAAKGVLIVGSAAKYSTIPQNVDNAVLPAWRDALIQMQLTTPWDSTKWDDMLVGQKRMTEEFNPLLAKISPSSGAYMNEADFNEPNWKKEWFGANYDKLLKIKEKWDPEGVFYALKTVGSDKWEIAADGRMCRAGPQGPPPPPSGGPPPPPPPPPRA